ncbi:MAG: hypothetical protein D6682_06770 [Zetaproteobacteria bacterium]|nr:MAG: hypothetical protein D6682_06770 [Zetaproteobacteria bacterium]
MPLILLLAGALLLAGCQPLHHTTAAGHAAAGNKAADSAQRQSHRQAAQQPTRRPIPLDKLEPEFLFLAAQRAIDQGQLARAAAYLTPVVARDPYAVLPRAQLAEALLKSGRPAASLPHFRALLEGPAATRLALGERIRLTLLKSAALLATHQRDAARATLRRLLADHPGQEGARIELARLLLADGDGDEALALIREGIQHRDSARLRQMEVQLLLRMGRFRQALAAMQSMLALEPDDGRITILFSHFAEQMKRPDLAEEQLRAFLRRHPGDKKVARTLGSLLLRQGRGGEAILLYRQLLKQNPDATDTRNTLGLLYLQNRHYHAAERLLAGAKDAEGRFYYAAALEAQKRDPEARAVYEQLRSSPLQRRARLRIAAIEARAGHDAKALAIVRALLADPKFRQPQRSEAWSLLSSILLQQKRYRQLIEQTAEALRQQPVDPRLLFNRAVAFEHFKRYDEAEEMVRRQLKLQPDNDEALNFLGYMLAERGVRLDEAEQLIRRALDHRPDDGYYLDSLAWVFYQRGDYAQAIRIQRKAIAQVGDDAVMYQHLGDMLWRHGERKEARANWRKALALDPPEPEALRARLRRGLQGAGP